MVKTADYLPDGTFLSHYQIESVLGGGGFSVVYLGSDTKNHQPVVIKEYFPNKLAKRDEGMNIVAKDETTAKYFKQGRKLFFQEASILAALNHPNIVNILGFHQAHGTIYSIMPYEKGLSLQAYLKKHGKQKSEQFLLSIFLPLLEGLKEVHAKGLLHLDIKPGNIYLRHNLSPILLDFGAVHKLILSAGSRLFPVVSHGFSPPEQSRRNAKLGPWSDLYAVGASLRACIEAKPPPPSKDRVKIKEFLPAQKAFEGEFSEQFLSAVDWAMQLEIEKRPQNVDDFIEVLPKATLT